MYAIKEAMIAKEHAHGELDCAVFNMDMRTFGKDYEKYYNRARDKDGVRFVKARIHTIDEDRETGDLAVKYADETGRHAGGDLQHGGAVGGAADSPDAADAGRPPGHRPEQVQFRRHRPLRTGGDLTPRHLCLRRVSGAQRHPGSRHRSQRRRLCRRRRPGRSPGHGCPQLSRSR